jgi:hypothetical protein
MYVPQGIDNNTRAALGDIPQLDNLAFGNESSIPGGITAQRMGIISESGIIQTVQQGEIFTLGRGEVANVVVVVTDAVNGTTAEETVEVVNTGAGIEEVAPVYTLQVDSFARGTKVELPEQDEVVLDPDLITGEDTSQGSEYEDPGATDVVNSDGNYVPADQVPIPTYDPTTDPYYDPYQDPYDYDQTV